MKVFGSRSTTSRCFGLPQSHGEYPHWPHRTQPFVCRSAAPHSGHARGEARGSSSEDATVSGESSCIVG